MAHSQIDDSNSCKICKEKTRVKNKSLMFGFTDSTKNQTSKLKHRRELTFNQSYWHLYHRILHPINFVS